MAASRAGARTSRRRRQRSVRVTSAVALLSVASVVVLGSLATLSALWLGGGAVLALAMCWAALRIMWTEVLQSRRENAADRAAAAMAYRTLFSARAAEHAEFTTAITERLAEAHISQRELEGLVVQHESRAHRAESQLVSESQALVATRGRVLELEEALACLRAEEAAGGRTEAAPATLAGWTPTGDSVVDLVAWDEQTQKAAKSARRAQPGLKQA